MRIKVHCIGILNAPVGPQAVIASDVRVTHRGHAPATARYVLMTYEQRAELGRVWFGAQQGNAEALFRTYPGDEFPRLVRAYAWDASGKLANGEPPTGPRIGRWGNAEAMWVRADVGLAASALDMFASWRRANPRTSPTAIWAPSWDALLGAQALALAAGLIPPGEDDTEATAPAAAPEAR